MRAAIGLVVVVCVLITVVAVVGAAIRPAGDPPKQPLPPKSAAAGVDSVDDLAGLSEEQLRGLSESAVDLKALAADTLGKMTEVSKQVRALDQSYVVPPVKGKTSSTGGSRHPRPRKAPRRATAQ